MSGTKFFSFFILVALIAMLVNACSTDETKTYLYGAFIAANPDPPDYSVAMVEREQTSDYFIVDITVFDINDTAVYAAAFDVVYNPEVIEFIEWEQGEYLEQTCSSVNYAVEPDSVEEGRIIVGITQSGSCPGVLGGIGVLLSMKFSVIAEKKTIMAFENNGLYDPDGKYITGILWYGGRAFGTETTR